MAYSETGWSSRGGLGGLIPLHPAWIALHLYLRHIFTKLNCEYIFVTEFLGDSFFQSKWLHELFTVEFRVFFNNVLLEHSIIFEIKDHILSHCVCVPGVIVFGYHLLWLQSKMDKIIQSDDFENQIIAKKLTLIFFKMIFSK